MLSSRGNDSWGAEDLMCGSGLLVPYDNRPNHSRPLLLSSKVHLCLQSLLHHERPRAHQRSSHLWPNQIFVRGWKVKTNTLKWLKFSNLFIGSSRMRDWFHLASAADIARVRFLPGTRSSFSPSTCSRVGSSSRQDKIPVQTQETTFATWPGYLMTSTCKWCKCEQYTQIKTKVHGHCCWFSFGSDPRFPRLDPKNCIFCFSGSF